MGTNEARMLAFANWMRIERAQVMLLHEPGRPEASVGFACGFDSESGFHRAFRTATGMTPGEYRRAWHSR